MIDSPMCRAAFLAAVVFALPLPRASAQAAGPVAPADVWKKVLDKAGREGEKGAADGFSTRSLTARSGDRKDGGAIYSIVVFYAAGTNKVAGVELGLERSTLITGTIRTHYWTLLVRPSGKVDQAVHKERVDVPGEDVIPGAPAIVPLADPKVKAGFDEMLRFWSAP